MEQQENQLRGILTRLNGAVEAYRVYVDYTAVEEIQQSKLDKLEGEEKKIITYLAGQGIAVGHTKLGQYRFIDLKPGQALSVTDRQQLEGFKAEHSIAERQGNVLKVTASWVIYEQRYDEQPSRWCDVFDLDTNLLSREPSFWNQMVKDPESADNWDKLFIVMKQLGQRGWTFIEIAEWLESIGL